ncbi:MAG TPA: hypothetical protein DG942_07655 [Ruminococcaceae bacterium]|nr:hypothetical protein [Oscillospiraceae bacterium]
MKFRLKGRIISIVLASVMLVAASGCTTGNGNSSTILSTQASSMVSSVQANSEKSKTQIHVLGLKGPTGLSMVKLMDDSGLGKAEGNCKFSIVASPDEVVSKLVNGEADIAAVPTNLAATFYNKTKGQLKLAAVTTLGVLSIVTNGEDVKSVHDLKGKTIIASGKGAVPEYVLDYILKQNGLQAGRDVKVEYKVQHEEAAAAVISGKAKVAMLPEPFVTEATVKNKNIKVALNLTKEWDSASKKASVLTMGCLAVRKSFAENHKAELDDFLNEYKSSVDFVNSNVPAAAKLSAKYGIMDAAVAQKAIPDCSIVYIGGNDMKTKVPYFLKVMYKANPKSVGGKLPGDDFYYQE